MNTYIFECYQEDGGCGNIFEIEALMDEAPSLKPTCKSCHKRKPVARNYQLQLVTIYDASPKTLGALAERNMSRFSEDKKQSIIKKNNAYKKQSFTGSLPKGANVVPKDLDGQRIVSKKQHMKDPRK